MDPKHKSLKGLPKWGALFLCGAVIGTLLDMLQTYGGEAYYTGPFLFRTAWWVPLLFGLGVVLIGVSHVRMDKDQQASGLKFIPRLSFLIVACLITAFGDVSNSTKTLLLLALYLFPWCFWDRGGVRLLLAVGTGVIGCLVESLLGKVGLYHYYRPDWIGIPYWLFFLYLHVSATAGYLGKMLVRSKTFLTVLVFFLVSSAAFADNKTEHFKELGLTQSKQHYFEGLWPVINPKSQDHYQFITHGKQQLLKVSHFNEKGELSSGLDGWAIYQLTYDEEGRVIESSFHKPSGSLSLSRSLKFAREVIQYEVNGKAKREYFSPEGRRLKTIGNDLGIGFFEVPLK